MMEFGEIVVKESPGLCRCCLSEGCYKDLGSEYAWMNDTEIYADMLLECFDIGISQHNEGPNGPNRLICEVCITRLRDACNFKKQVVDSEKKFVDMVGRGEFGPKVVIYQTTMKSEQGLEEPHSQELEVEYLDEDMQFDDADDQPLSHIEAEPSGSEDVALHTVKVKGKRGRPKKTAVKTEKKPKMVHLEEKPRSSRAVTKGINMKQDNRENYLARLASARRNILLALHYGRLLPFHWSTKGYRCFYCDKPMKDCETLKEHTSKHQTVDLETFTQKIVTKDLPIKIDVSNIGCKVCGEDMQTIEDLTGHITSAHGEEYDLNAGVCLFPFILNKDIMKCVLCENSYDNFMCMMTHMHKEHMTHSCICQICGLSFADKMKLKRHISNSHNGHKCTVCEKVFDAFHKLERHKQRIHGHIKTYECNLCSGTFDSDYQVKVHMGKVHNVEKYRIKCEYCAKITTTKGAMMLHIQSMHSDVKYKCDICDYTAGVKWMIKLHKRKHFGNKDYSCSICDRRFGRSSNVRTHMKVHTGSFGRVCRWCRQGFTDLETLHIHEMEVHYYNQYN